MLKELLLALSAILALTGGYLVYRDLRSSKQASSASRRAEPQ